MMFEGLMSRCVRPVRCSAPSASASSSPIRRHSSAGSVPQLCLQSLRGVTGDLDLRARDLIVGEFHHVIKEPARHTAADVENIDEPVVRAGDRLERRHSLKLPVESALALEGVPINHLHRPQRSGQAARQPNLAVTAPPDDAEHFMIGNRRNAHCFSLYRQLSRRSMPLALRRSACKKRGLTSPFQSVSSFFSSALRRCFAR